MSTLSLTSPLSQVLRTTQDHLAALNEMGIATVLDLLLYLPRGHEDQSAYQLLATAPLGEKVSVMGTIGELKLTRIRGGRTIVSTIFTDSEGSRAQVTWFNQPHIKRMLPDHSTVVLTGKLSEKGSKLIFQSPSFEIAGNAPLVHSGRLVPIYPEHAIISTKWLREKMVLIKDAIAKIEETLPQSILEDEQLIARSSAILALHFPESLTEVEQARDRIAFEEMYRVQKEALIRKKNWQSTVQERIAMPMDSALVRLFFQSLGFTPTASQKIAIYEILRDMEKSVPMSRLLEGDVGSGKTLVATVVMGHVLRYGGQCALMVPTEVLARQHITTIGRLLTGFHRYVQEHGSESERSAFHLPNIALLTGSIPAGEAADVREKLNTGSIDVVIGTHALIEDSVRFHDLRLVIVDEQHRFGVQQRERLREKGSPHFLSMTATPIPRTLALTAFGDHDLSVLLEKPGNRPPIKTAVAPPSERHTIELFIDREIEKERQVFVICPLIRSSEAEEIREVKSVEAEVLRLKDAFPKRTISMLHGRMSAAEKEAIMREFKERKADILVSTSVIEVGIDVPNATIIVIEGSERFGLSQLHQFRGRTGRSDLQSYCFLFTTTVDQAKNPRLKAMEKETSGFRLAEVDLELRGPGELYGVRQSGLPDAIYPHLLKPEFVVRVRRAAERELGIAMPKAA